MSEGMSSEQIERVFSALGRIESKLDTHVELAATHAEHDETVHKLLFSRVETLQLSHARQKGFITAVAGIASAGAAGIGYLIERWLGHH
jgi:hypothetical protein